MKFKSMRWQEIEKHLPKDKPLIGAEIGVWTGKTSAYLLEHFPLLTMYMVDAWTEASNIPSFKASGAKMAKYPQDVYDNAYKTVCEMASKYPKRAHVIKEESIVASRRFPLHFFDLIFLDSDHSYENVSKEIDAWFPSIKNGGLLMGHDIGRGFKGVAKAVYERFKESEVELGDDTTYFIRVPQ